MNRAELAEAGKRKARAAPIAAAACCIDGA
jgi:hypothetical protein